MALRRNNSKISFPFLVMYIIIMANSILGGIFW